MFLKSLFSDYKTEDEIDTNYIIERMKKHYMFYKSLIKIWEEKTNKGVLVLEQDTLMKFNDPDMRRFKETVFGVKDIQRELKEYLVIGEDPYIEMMKKRIDFVEKEIAFRFLKSDETKHEKIETIRDLQFSVETGLNDVQNLRYAIQNTQMRSAELTNQYGKNIVRKTKLLKILEILKQLTPLKYLGASRREDVLNLLEIVVTQELDFLGAQKLKIVQKCLGSLKSRLDAFEKEFIVSFSCLLDSFNSDRMIKCFEFMKTMKNLSELWEIKKEFYSEEINKIFQGVFLRLGDPLQIIETTLAHLKTSWFSYFDHKREEGILVDSNVYVNALMNLSQRFILSLTNWDKVIGYSYKYEEDQRQKMNKLLAKSSEFLVESGKKNEILDETNTTTPNDTLDSKDNQGTEDSIELKHNDEFLDYFRCQMFFGKKTLVEVGFSGLEKAFSDIPKSQALTFNARRISELKQTVAECYFKASKFSVELPKTTLGKKLSVLIDNFMEVNIKNNLDFLVRIASSTNFELKEVKKETINQQIQDILDIAEKMKETTTFSLKEGDSSSPLYFCQEKAKLLQKLKQQKAELDPEFDREAHLLDEYRALSKNIKPLNVHKLTKSVLKNLENFLDDDSYDTISLEKSGSVLFSIYLIFAKLCLCLPEYTKRFKSNLKFIKYSYVLFMMLKFVPSVTIQFMVSSEKKIMDLKDPKQLQKLENSHDILLFQKQYPKLRKFFNVYDKMLEKSPKTITVFLKTKIAEIIRTTSKNGDIQEKMSLRYQKSLSLITSMNNILKVDFFRKKPFDRSNTGSPEKPRTKVEEPNGSQSPKKVQEEDSGFVIEIESLFIYYIFMSFSKKKKIFSDIAKKKWETIKAPNTDGSQYTKLIIASIHSQCKEIKKLTQRMEVSQTRTNNIYEKLMFSNIKSLVDIFDFGSILHPKKEVLSQMKIDIMKILKSMESYSESKFESTQNYALNYICSYTEDENAGLSFISKNLDTYCLRLIKALYLYNNTKNQKDSFSVKSFFGSKSSNKKIVIKSEKIMNLFDLARSCIVALTENSGLGVDLEMSSAHVLTIMHGANLLSKKKPKPLQP